MYNIVPTGGVIGQDDHTTFTEKTETMQKAIGETYVDGANTEIEKMNDVDAEYTSATTSVNRDTTNLSDDETSILSTDVDMVKFALPQFLGEWSGSSLADHTYSLNGDVWIALTDSTTSPVEGDAWKMFAGSLGDTGVAGPTGDTGPAGGLYTEIYTDATRQFAYGELYATNSSVYQYLADPEPGWWKIATLPAVIPDPTLYMGWSSGLAAIGSDGLVYEIGLTSQLTGNPEPVDGQWTNTLAVGPVKSLAGSNPDGSKIVLLENGDMWGMESNITDSIGPCDTSPIKAWAKMQVPAGNIIKVTSGYASHFILYDDGKLYCLGGNYFGNLGLGNTTDINAWTLTATDAVDVSAASFSHYVDSAGDVWGCGAEGFGGGIGQSTSWVKILSGLHARNLRCGQLLGPLLVDTDDGIYGTGDNINSALVNVFLSVIDDIQKTDRQDLVQVVSANDTVAIQLRTDGKVYSTDTDSTSNPGASGMPQGTNSFDFVDIGLAGIVWIPEYLGLTSTNAVTSTKAFSGWGNSTTPSRWTGQTTTQYTPKALPALP